MGILPRGLAIVLRTEPTSVLALSKILEIRDWGEMCAKGLRVGLGSLPWINKAKVILLIDQYMYF